MSSVKYDIESLLLDVKAILVANLNTRVAAIEAEKIAAGAITTGILPVDTSKGYFEQSWSDAILNINPAIFYGIENVTAKGDRSATIEEIKVFVEIILLDSGQDGKAKNQIHRYTRAIKEVFEENWDKLKNRSPIKIETVRPVSFRLDLNSSEEIKVGGVSLTVGLG